MKLEAGLLIGGGKYKLTHCLGYGGQAEVWEAEQQGLAGFTKTIVLKLVTPDRRGDHQLYQNLLREAQLSSLLNHPNIAEVYDVGEDDGLLYIAMERIDGRDLEHVLQQSLKQTGGPLPWPLAVRMVADVCKGLQHVHTKTDAKGEPLDLVHRDLKPSNILLSSEGFVKVIDFGVAKAATTTQVTRQGAVRGTPAYMAPEQIRSLPTDGRADLFSMGAVLYELVTGKRAFLDEDLFALFYAVLSKIPPAPAQLVPTLPKALSQVIAKAMAKSPSGRYQEAKEMHKALTELLREQKEYPEPSDLAGLYDELCGQEEPLSLAPSQRGGQRTGQTMSYGLPTDGPVPLAEQRPLAEVLSEFNASAQLEGEAPDETEGIGLFRSLPEDPKPTEKAQAPRPKPPVFQPSGSASSHSSLPPPPMIGGATLPPPKKVEPKAPLAPPASSSASSAALPRPLAPPQPFSPTETQQVMASDLIVEPDEPEQSNEPVELDEIDDVTRADSSLEAIKNRFIEPAEQDLATQPKASPYLLDGAADETTGELGRLDAIEDSLAGTTDGAGPSAPSDIDEGTMDLSREFIEGAEETGDLKDTQPIALPPDDAKETPSETLRSPAMPPSPLPSPLAAEPTDPASTLPASLSQFAAMIDGRDEHENTAPQSAPTTAQPQPSTVSDTQSNEDDDVLAFSFPSETSQALSTTDPALSSSSDPEYPGVYSGDKELSAAGFGGFGSFGGFAGLDDAHRRRVMIIGVAALFFIGLLFILFRDGDTPPKTLAKSKTPARSTKTGTKPPSRMASWNTFQINRQRKTPPRPASRTTTPPTKALPRLRSLPRSRAPDPVLLPLPRRTTPPRPAPRPRKPPVRRRRKVLRRGSIRFRIKPSCHIYAGRRKLGHSSRLRLRRRPGRYRFRCINRSQKLYKTFSVRVRSGRRTTLRRSYRKGKLFLVSYPWSQIELSPFGKIGYSQAAISLWEGRYTLRLYRKGKRNKRKLLRVRIRAGRTTRPNVLRW